MQREGIENCMPVRNLGNTYVNRPIALPATAKNDNKPKENGSSSGFGNFGFDEAAVAKRRAQP